MDNGWLVQLICCNCILSESNNRLEYEGDILPKYPITYRHYIWANYLGARSELLGFRISSLLVSGAHTYSSTQIRPRGGSKTNPNQP